MDIQPTSSASEYSTRETFISDKSSSVDLIDASCQANISCDVITYDSDDEMVKSRRGIPFGGLRNKKGHPIYSREDIREQYCITRKELEVLEHSLHDSSATRLFGCLSTSHLPDSHCNKSSFLLLSCVHRRKNSSEIDEESDNGKRLQLSNSQLVSNVSEDDDSDGGFRQRSFKPYSRVVTSEQQRYNHLTQGLRDNTYFANNNNKTQTDNSKVRLQQSLSSGYQDMESSSVRPKMYNHFDTSKETSLISSTSHSADELLDRNNGHKWCSQRIQKSPEFISDASTSSKKHVSFDASMVRSVTCVEGINMNASQHISRQYRNVSPPSISVSSTSSSRREMSPPVASQERLLGTKSTQKGLDSDPNQKFQQSVSPSLSYTPSVSTPCRIVRRVVMKTQATQTEITGLVKSRSSRSIPAYLTLSPRAHNQHIVQRRSFDLRRPTTSMSICQYHQKLLMRKRNSLVDSNDDNNAIALPLIKSRSAHGIMINSNSIDSSDDEVMQVCIDRDLNGIKSTKSKDSFRDDDRLTYSGGICDNHIDEPFLTTFKPTIKSYSNDEVFMPKKKANIDDEDNILSRALTRRHSAIAELAAEPIGAVPIALPPPGFEDVMIDEKVDIPDNIDLLESSPKKSSTESSHALITDEGSDLISSTTTTDMDDLQSSTNNSKLTSSSPTVVSELNADVPLTPPIGSLTQEVLPLVKSDSIEIIELNKIDSPIIRLKKQFSESLNSPDSESSGHITSSTSSYGHLDVEQIEKVEDSGSSDYIRATDETPKAVKEVQPSLEASSSVSILSSSPTHEIKSSDSSHEEVKTMSPDIETATPSVFLIPTIKRPTSLPSKRYLMRSEEACDERRSSSSSDASMPRSPRSPESIASTHYSANIDEFDSETHDLTPVLDICSSDPSTAFEPTTVIENTPSVKPKVPPKPSFLTADLISFKDNGNGIKVSDSIKDKSVSEEKPLKSQELMEELKNNISKKILDLKSKSDSSEAISPQIEEEDEDVIDEPSGGGIIMRRSLSGELSTVSEVSEEISANGIQKSITYSAGKECVESLDKESGAPVLTLSSDNIAIHSGASSASLEESTTSGSFMIDGNGTEPTSAADSDLAAMGKAGSLPCIPTQEVKFLSVIKVASEGEESPLVCKPTDTTVTTDLGPNGSLINRRYEPMVGQLIDLGTESSQATERDIERSEFSLQQQSSQDIDEESLSLDALNHSISPKEEEVVKEELEIGVSHAEDSQEELALIQELSTSESTTTQQFSDDKQIDVSEDVFSSKSVAKLKKPSREHQRNSSSESHPLLSQEEFYIMQRRARSLSRSPEKALESESPTSLHYQSCSHHHFTCSECGEAANHHNVPSILRRSRLERTGIPYLYRKSMTIDDIYFDGDDEEDDIGVHTESYRSALWVYIGRKEEMAVWGHRNPLNSNGDRSLPRSESDESTLSEKGFRKHYEAITHRLIHRKASIEMYKRVLNRTFVIEKCLSLVRNNGEFGFRIHGSRPVVVSAIEKGTPAELNGLEVGDIIVTVNDVNVLDASHSDVVRLAHTGSDKLKLEVVCTSKTIKKHQPPLEHDIIMNGYLSRLTDRTTDRESGEMQIATKKLWRRRWFVLKSDFCLYWYKNPKCTDPVGALSLQGYCAGVSQESIFGQSFVFRLVRYATPQKYFAANDCETAGQWVNALNQSATRINQIDPYIDTTLHNIHKNPLSFKHLDCYGYLGKFSKRRKVWRHRYFVLKDACLYFYIDPNSNTALGVFYLHGYKVQTCAMIGKKHTFEAIPPEPKFRHLWLLAETDADKKRWLAALEYSIDRWIKLK